MKNSASEKTAQEIIQEKIEKNTPRLLQVVVVTETGNRVALSGSQFQRKSSNVFFAGADAKQLKADTIKYFKDEFAEFKKKERAEARYSQEDFDSAKEMAEARFEVDITIDWENAPVDKYGSFVE